MAVIFDIRDQQSIRETTLVTSVWTTILGWLEQASKRIPTGEIDIDGRLGIRAVISQIKLPVPNTTAKRATLEVHQKNIDVHCCFTGQERIDYNSSTSLLIVQKYDQETDTALFLPTRYSHNVFMRPGIVAVFFPTDAHRPLQQVHPENKFVKKVVIKLPIKALY